MKEISAAYAKRFRFQLVPGAMGGPGVLNNIFRSTTPTPEMPLFQSGVQEPALLQGITIPALYAASFECLVLRSILTHLATECFRKGWVWKPKFVSKCRECEEEYQKEVDTCLKCGGEVRPADKGQLDYADALLNSENRMAQSFLEVLREVEMDLNIVDDAYIILTKEYFVDRSILW